MLIFIEETKKTGINAMLVSNLTGMPRATVTRKLIVDSKKLYNVEKKI